MDGWLFSPVAAPDLLDPKSAADSSKPRLSILATPAAAMDPPRREGHGDDVRKTVMRGKTVLTIFFLVVLYLIIGATVFSALEQPHESSQKLAIVAEKLDFLAKHACVNSSELEALVKVSAINYSASVFSSAVSARRGFFLKILMFTHKHCDCE